MPQYEIRLRGRLDPSWSDWLGGLAVSPTGTGETLLSGSVVDQAAGADDQPRAGGPKDSPPGTHAPAGRGAASPKEPPR